MTKRAFAELMLDASPTEVSNILIPIMWSARILVRRQTIEEEPLRIALCGEHASSLRSWGEFIKITITQDGKESKVKAESKAKVSGTIFDYGQNKENLEVLLNQLVIKCRSTSPLTIEERTF